MPKTVQNAVNTSERSCSVETNVPNGSENGKIKCRKYLKIHGIATGKPTTMNERPSRCGSSGKIPSPGGRVAPKGSGEECGRQAGMTEIFRPPAGSDLRGGLENGTDFQIFARIPLQSPVGSEEPTGDSFSPGEAKGAPAPVLLSLQ